MRTTAHDPMRAQVARGHSGPHGDSASTGFPIGIPERAAKRKSSSHAAASKRLRPPDAPEDRDSSPIRIKKEESPTPFPILAHAPIYRIEEIDSERTATHRVYEVGVELPDGIAWLHEDQPGSASVFANDPEQVASDVHSRAPQRDAFVHEHVHSSLRSRTDPTRMGYELVGLEMLPPTEEDFHTVFNNPALGRTENKRLVDARIAANLEATLRRYQTPGEPMVREARGMEEGSALVAVRNLRGDGKDNLCAYMGSMIETEEEIKHHQGRYGTDCFKYMKETTWQDPATGRTRTTWFNGRHSRGLGHLANTAVRWSGVDPAEMMEWVRQGKISSRQRNSLLRDTHLVMAKEGINTIYSEYVGEYRLIEPKRTGPGTVHAPLVELTPIRPIAEGEQIRVDYGLEFLAYLERELKEKLCPEPGSIDGSSGLGIKIDPDTDAGPAPPRTSPADALEDDSSSLSSAPGTGQEDKDFENTDGASDSEFGVERVKRPRSSWLKSRIIDDSDASSAPAEASAADRGNDDFQDFDDVSDSDFDAQKTKQRHASARSHNPCKSALTDAEIIARLPDGLHEHAKKLAGQDNLPTGVRLKKRKGESDRYCVFYFYKSLPSFAVSKTRTDFDARTLAIATRLALEVESDKEFVAALPKGIYEKAQKIAKEKGKKKGVHFRDGKGLRKDDYVCTFLRKEKLFTVTESRSSEEAFILAIAWRIKLESENKYNNDEKTTSIISDEIYKKSKYLAKKNHLPNGVTFKEGKNGRKDTYVSRYGQETIGNFTVTESRSAEMAKILAIATRLEREKVINLS